MKRPYVSPSMEAIRLAEEPERGFVFSSIYMEGEKIVTGTDCFMADAAESRAKASMNDNIPNTKRSK